MKVKNMSSKKITFIFVAAFVLGMLSMHGIASTVINRSLLDLMREVEQCEKNLRPGMTCEIALSSHYQRYK